MNTKRKQQNQAVAGEISGEMPIASVSHAPWNPRMPEELHPTHPAMVSLIDSVRALGIVQPIAVWVGSEAADILGDGNSVMCIAGNRRLEAARAVGLKMIPVHVFDQLTEESARAITRAENECRFGVTPMMDARLVKSLLDIGRSQAEIAALVGVSEATICRRVKLLDLDASVVDAIGDADVDARSLEKIAAFPVELQKKAAPRILDRIKVGAVISPAFTDSIFADLTHIIHKDLWIFEGERGERRLKICLSCPHLSGNHRDLFDAIDDTHGESDSSMGEGRGEYGRCLRAKCYKRMAADAKSEIISHAVEETSGGEGAEKVVMVRRRCDEPFAELNVRKRKGVNTCAYVVWDDYVGFATVRWGLSPERYAERDRKEKADAAKKAAEIERVEGLVAKAVGIVDRYLFGDSAGRHYRDEDFCYSALEAFPADFVRRLAAKGLVNLFVDSIPAYMAKEALSFARNVPEIKTLLSSEEVAALESRAGG